MYNVRSGKYGLGWGDGGWRFVRAPRLWWTFGTVAQAAVAIHRMGGEMLPAETMNLLRGAKFDDQYDDEDDEAETEDTQGCCH